MDLFICPHCKSTLFLRIKCEAYNIWIIYQCTCRYDVAVSETFKEIVLILRIIENLKSLKYFFGFYVVASCNTFLCLFTICWIFLLSLYFTLYSIIHVYCDL